MTDTIILATPHARNDGLERQIGKSGDLQVVRVYSPEELSNVLRECQKPRYVFFPHWSWIIPDSIHAVHECVIFHMTALPFGRGGSPLQNLIQRGVQLTKVSALRCVSALDAGPIYCQRDLTLDGTAEAILRRCSLLVEDMILEILRKNPQPLPQAGEPTIFMRRKPSQSDISLADSPATLYDQIRMLDADGYPRAFGTLGNFRLEFFDAFLAEDEVEAKVRFYLKVKSSK